MSDNTRLFENFDQLLTYEQTSMWLGLSKSALTKYVHRKQIPYLKLGNKTVRFKVGDVHEWIQSKKIGEKNGN